MYIVYDINVLAATVKRSKIGSRNSPGVSLVFLSSNLSPVIHESMYASLARSLLIMNTF